MKLDWRRFVFFIAASTLPMAVAISAEQYGPIAAKETLWNIARQYSANNPGASTWAWVDAIQRKNPDAFSTSNGQLLVGSMLAIPEMNEVLTGNVEKSKVRMQRSPSSAKVSKRNSSLARTEMAPLSPYVYLPSSGIGLIEAVRQESYDDAARNFSDGAEGDLKARALSLLKQKRAAEAFELLSPFEDEFSGQPDFDYLIGVAAMDSGRPGDALFPLQRVVVQESNNAGARLELARALFELGDNESARKEFNELAALNPPEKVQTLIANYLDAIDRRSAKYRETSTRYVTLGAGYDDNANSGTSALQFQGVDLDDQTVNQSSEWWAIGAGASWSKPLKPRLYWQSSVSASHRQLPSAAFVSTTQGSFRSGLTYSHEGTTYGGGATLYGGLIDEDSNNVGVLFDGSVSHQINSDWQAGGVLRAGVLTFADDVKIRDVNQVLLAGTLGRKHQFFRGGQVGLSLVGGHDSARRDGSPNGRDLYGARLTASALLHSTFNLSLGGGILSSSYDGLFAGNNPRLDRQYSFSINGLWLPTRFKGWQVMPHITFVKNESDILLFEYDRWEAGVTLRRSATRTFEALK